MGVFSVTRLTVDADDNIIDVDWNYTNDGELYYDTLRLAKPYGDRPLAECTEPVLVAWVKQQIETTSEQLDAYLANRKAQREYSQSLQSYVPHKLRGPTKDIPLEQPSTLPAPLPDEPSAECPVTLPAPVPEAPTTMPSQDPARLTRITLKS